MKEIKRLCETYSACSEIEEEETYAQQKLYTRTQRNL